MSRVIKFKSFYRGNWYEVLEAYFEAGVIFPARFKGYIFSPDLEHVKCTVQFTGLLDKDGKEIYEGDLVERNETGCEGIFISKYKVGYKENAFVLEVIQSHTWKPGAIVSVMGELTTTGNIYENA